MNGADRFQLFFDKITRRVTGCGNVIRALITVKGIIPESEFHKLVATNEALRYLISVYPERRWYSTVYKWKRILNIDTINVLNIHKGKNHTEEIEKLLSMDCPLLPGKPLRLDIFYDDENTTILISVNHAMLDYGGMENLIGSIAGNQKTTVPVKPTKVEGSFLRKFSNAVTATFYVAARTSWNLRRLKKNSSKAKSCMVVMLVSKEESGEIKNRLQYEIKSSALPFYVAAAVKALNKNEELLTDKSGDFFIAVPLDRRPADHKNVLLSNYLSFVYFNAPWDKIKDVKNLSAAFNIQMIQQARKKMPEKFISLMELFRFLPPVIYWAWMNLPTKGHSASFAFSLLDGTSLQLKTFMGFQVIDVTHYPPLIAPPGLNMVVTVFRNQLKIIASYDESRITKEQVRSWLTETKNNLLN